MQELKREYEAKLQNVTENVQATSEPKKSVSRVTIVEDITDDDGKKDEVKINNRIKSIKDILIGGERANDTQLKEKRFKKKLASQKKLK
jgi:kinesin family protein 3/17